MSYIELRNKIFPLWDIPNIKRFYLLTILTNTWFLSANWIFYWLRFMNYGQLGVVEATCFLFGLIMEVPSGAIADLIGKRKTLMYGMFLAALGFVLMGTANSLPPLWIGFLLAQAGWAFYSGAAEALAYDSLVDKKKEDQFEKVISTSGSLATVTTVLAIMTGGVMYVLHYRSTHLAMSVAIFLAWIVSFGLREPHSDTDKFEIHKWWETLKAGVRQLFLPALKPFVVVIFLLMGANYIYDWGLLQPAIATSFGYFDRGQAVAFTIFGILGALIIRALPKLRARISDKRGLYLLTILMGLGFALAAFPLGYWGIIAMLIISLSGQLVYPWISVVVNKEIAANHRATALSTVALITKIPYVFVAIIAGKMIDRGDLWLFNAVVSGAIIFSIIVSIALTRSRKLAFS